MRRKNDRQSLTSLLGHLAGDKTDLPHVFVVREFLALGFLCAHGTNELDVILEFHHADLSLNTTKKVRSRWSHDLIYVARLTAFRGLC